MPTKQSRTAPTIPPAFHGTWEVNRELTNRHNDETFEWKDIPPLEYDIRITFTENAITILVDGQPIPHCVQIISVASYSILVELRHPDTVDFEPLRILYFLADDATLRRVITQDNFEDTRYFPLPVDLSPIDC